MGLLTRLLLCALALTGCRRNSATVDAAPPIEAFAGIVKAEFERVHPGQSLRYDGERFTLEVETDAGRGGTLNLRNLYEDYRAATPGNRPASIARLVQSMDGTRFAPESFAAVRERLLPVVREGLYFDWSERMPGRSPIVHRPLTELLDVGLVIDHEENIAFVSRADLDRWSESWEALWPIAIANLERKSTEAFESPSPGVYVSPWRGNHDAARLLLLARVRALALKGAPVAMVPNRDTLIITGDGDVAGLERMAGLTEEALRAPRPMVAIALRLEGGSWKSFRPGITPAMKEQFQRLELQSMNSLYADQKANLEDSQRRTQEDVFVASFVVFANGTSGALASTAAWTKGVPTLLPKTDTLSLVDPDGKEGAKGIGIAEWDRVQKVVGPGMRPMGLRPERFRVDSFPGPEQLRAILAH